MIRLRAAEAADYDRVIAVVDDWWGRPVQHALGVNPRERGSGLARLLYERFFALAVADGRRVVRAVTAPVNTASIAFHTAMGNWLRGQRYSAPGNH